MKRRFVMCAPAAAIIAACSSTSPEAPGPLPFTVRDSIFFGSSGAYEIKLLDYAPACSLQQASDSHLENSEYIELIYTGATAPTAGQTYSVGPSTTISIHQRDAMCAVTESDATSGSVTVDSADATTLSGHYDAVVPGFGHFGGTFSADFCDTSVTTGSKQCVAQLGDAGGGIGCGLGPPCGSGQTCCADVANATRVCSSSCTAANTIDCNVPSDCSGGMGCCATVVLNGGTIPNCTVESVSSACVAGCVSNIASSCQTTDTMRVCTGPSDCAPDTANPNCCNVKGLDVCVSDAFKSFAALSCL